MVSPITWQNINGASLAEASRPLELAQRGFNTSFDQLGAVLAQREAIDAQNQIIQRGNNTQDFQDKLAALGRTPEQLAAAIQSGAVDKLRAGYGPNIDRAATRGAAEALLAQRYNQVGAANTFNDAQIDRTQAPIKDQIGSLIATGRTAEAQRLLAANELRGEAALYGAIDTRGQVDVERNRATQDFVRKGQKFEDDLLTNKSQRASAAQSILASQENIKNSQEQRQTNKTVRESAKAAASANQLKQSLGEQGNLYADGVYTGRNADVLSELMGKSGVGDNNTDRANILKRFAKGEIEIDVDGKKVNVPIPNSALKSAILASKDSWYKINPFKTNEGWASDAEDNLKAILQQTYKTTDEDGKPIIRSKTADDYAAYNGVLKGLQQNPSVKKDKTVKNPLNK